VLRPALIALAAAALASAAWAADPAPAPDPAPIEGDVIAAPHPATHLMEFKIVAAEGVVAFSVPETWRVVGMKSFPPVAGAAFQVVNPADEGTSDATNVAVDIYHTDDAAGRAGLALMGKAYGASTPHIDHYQGWTTYASEPTMTATPYTLIDATRPFADLHVTVGVRCAWPHLAKNAPGYDAQMLAACHALLGCIYGQTGPYTPAPGEVVRRPPPATPAG
jgi:hypothetical protein